MGRAAWKDTLWVYVSKTCIVMMTTKDTTLESVRLTSRNQARPRLTTI